MTTETDFTGTMAPGAVEVGELPEEMLKAFDMMAENPEQARAIARVQGTGMADISKSKVHWAGKPLPEFVHLYSDDGTPSVIPTARMGYYVQKGFHISPPMGIPEGTFFCPRPGCVRGKEGHGLRSELILENHIKAKHRKLWAEMERTKSKEERDAAARANHELLAELARLLRGTTSGSAPRPGELSLSPEYPVGVPENELVVSVSNTSEPIEPSVQVAKPGLCPDCKKKIKNYKLHKPYCKGDDNA